MKSVYLVLFIIVFLIVADVVMWGFPTYFSVSVYFKITVLGGLAFIAHRDVGIIEGTGPDLNLGYISEMVFLLFFSLWFALLHHINVDYLSKASGFGFIAAAFALFSLIVVFVEKLMLGGVLQKLTLFSMKVFTYLFLVLGVYLLVLGEWQWELISLFDLLP